MSLCGYYTLIRFEKYSFAKALIIAMSMFFVCYAGIEHIYVLIISIIINYLIGFLLAKRVSCNAELIHNILLVIGVSFNISILLLFKYYNFFINNINVLFGKHLPNLGLLVPLGISFYTFQQISFIVDSYHNADNNISILDYILYVSFFPRYTQGPIVGYGDFTGQLTCDSLKKGIDYELMSIGLSRFLIGLSKKVIIADNIALIVDGGYNKTGSLNGLSAFIIIIAYTLQIYFDFSGYSDMAIGIANLFNIELPENFDSPYKADSISGFWDRWHISLTSFFRNYLYIPLGGNRKGKIRTYSNIMVIFLLSGLWHGADWSFVVWGMLHGTALIFERAFGKMIQTIPKFVRKTITLLYVSFAWVFFRSDSLNQARSLLGRLRYWNEFSISGVLREDFETIVEWTILKRLDLLQIENMMPGFIIIIVLLVLSSICLFTNNSKSMAEKISCSKSTRVAVVVLAILSIISFTGVNKYIYWNF